MTSQAHAPGPALSSCPSSAPSLLLPAFPGAALLVTSADAPGSKLIIKLKREGPMVGGAEEMPRTQTFFLAGMPLGWTTQRRDGPAGPNVRTVLLTKAGEEPGGRKPRVPETVLSARGAPPSDASFACTSKGVYENYRRWQRYKALARRHFPTTPDAEALACFFIPVLRSLARLRPDMTLEDGVPRAVQEWEHSSNFERMIFYEMAEKFMEFEAEEEQQIQKMKLLANCSQFQASKPAKLPTSPAPAPESGQQQVYIPKKSASKSCQPRRRQRRPPSASALGAPREIPAEAVHQYAEIMEGLDTSWEEDEDEKKEPGMCRGPQGQEDGVFPDPALLQYIDQLCDNEEFVCKVEAVIHPQFMADLLSPEKSQDPLDLAEELAEELNLTPIQLTEKRLLALSEEEREPSVCPTSHSDSTPSQSEEEDEVCGNGKGEDTLGQAMKRPSTSKGMRTTQPEFPKPVISSPLASHLHQRPGDRDFPPKGVRDAVNSSPHECGSHDSQEGDLPLSLRNTDEGETKNSQGQDHVGGHPNRFLPHFQWVRSEATPNKTEKNRLTGDLASQRDNKAGQGISRPSTIECSKQDGSQEGKVKGQMEIPMAKEQDSHGVIPQFHNGAQLVWNSLESVHKKCRKQDGSQKGEVKCLKKVQANWEVHEDVLKVSGRNSQDLNRILLGDHTAGERALQIALNGPGELNVDHVEEVIAQSQVQDSRGSKDTSSKTELDCQSKEMRTQWDNQMKQGSQEFVQLECEKQDGCQGAVIKDLYQFQAILKWPKSTPDVIATQFGSIHPCCQSLETQDNLTSALPEPGNELDGQETEVNYQKKPQSIKVNSPVKNRRLSEDKLAPQKQSTPNRQDGQESTDPPMVTMDQEANLKPHVEFSRGNGQQLIDSGGIGVLEDQPPGIGSKNLPYVTFSVLESPFLPIQKGSRRFQKSPWPLIDHCKVENLSDDKQTLKCTLESGYGLMVEADGASCGPGGDYTPIPTTASKEEATIPQQLSLQDSHENDEPNQRFERSDPASSEVHCGPVGSEKDTKNPSKVRVGDLLERVTVGNVMLPEFPGGSMEGTLKGEVEGEEEEEDEELSSFSSLLACKLSLSSHRGHVSLAMGEEDTVLSSPTDPWKQGAKMRHSARGPMPQNSPALPNMNQEASPAVHRSHKRKSNSSGTRRSKRLRNQ